MLKKILKVLLVVVIIITIGIAYLYSRLHNTIENVLVAEDNWRSEVLEFPLLFAGDLDYQGEEHIRFAPGWGKKDSEDYFSYVFLWIIQENPNLDTSKLENIINTYFDGLMNTGAITNLNFFKKIPKTTSSFQQIDKNTFTGSIKLYDEFFKKGIIELNAKITTDYCSKEGKYLVWFYLSPQNNDHPIWDQLTEVNMNAKCD
ncbi:hypothetical protein NBT05_13465 [Aquimarina sp. ERC-38]|uniref:hypothetical protein n=1 Tax=Aquimarina sp. ERC-38 TaxID=2949996 RepID=UPI002246FA89|nr:hypothetical protein [Aquimarina sp. ERC-38]UZO79953.1 hypothetical protein NBT05_13465 [Aquimarina sp. ERC-38]